MLGVPLVTPGEMAQRADVIFICVPDRAIGEAAEALAAEAVRGGIDVRGKFAYHVSGSAQCDVLAPLAKLGMEVGSLHPLQSFAVPRDSLADIGMAVDGTPKAQALANDLARLAGAVPFNVPAEERAAYHAAACFCSNYAVTVMALAQNCSAAGRQAKKKHLNCCCLCLTARQTICKTQTRLCRRLQALSRAATR